MAVSNTMIHASQIEKHCGSRLLLTDVSFFLPAGSYTYLTGATGSGKTTLLEMIAGLQRPDSGSLVVNGVEMHEIDADRLPFVRRAIGLVQTYPALIDNRSTTDNVRLPLDIAGFEKRAASERVSNTLRALGLTTIADIPVKRLTDDQRWLTACARATVHNPTLILMDQPPSQVSDSAVQRQQDLAKRHCTAGATVLVTASEPDDEQKARTIELKRGRALTNEFRTAVH